LVDKNLLNDQLLKNLLLNLPPDNRQMPKSPEDMVSLLLAEILTIASVEKVSTMDEVMLAVLDGNTALFVDGTDQVIIISSKGWESRAIEEPQSEALIRGPRDGFTEDIRTNIARIRRRLRDPNLRLYAMRIGQRGKRDVVVAYMKELLILILSRK